MKKDEKSIQELIDFILSVDRRYLVMAEFQNHKLLQASHIAKKTGRSSQNCSRALKELEKKGIVITITPEKRSWKRYKLGKNGKKILNIMKKQGWLKV